MRMHWIAWLRPDPPARSAAASSRQGWPLLRFTPRVALLDEAWLLEVSTVLRLWGGRARLLQQLQRSVSPHGGAMQCWAQGETAPVALALARLQACGEPRPNRLPDGLPLHVLSAARAHLPVLTRLGCQTWGDLRALPRGGLARRFGPALPEALDVAWGLRAPALSWLTLPQVFDEALELPQPARQAAEMLEAAQWLLDALQLWLRQRQLGVLTLRWDWRFDLRRIDGAELPDGEGMTLRTAVPTQDARHLIRLLQERWTRMDLKAPVCSLRLCSDQVQPWQGMATSWLPDEVPHAQRLHALVERLQARLGDEQVCQPMLCEDHRPECMQHWQPAQVADMSVRASARVMAEGSAALLPPWLLKRPLALDERDGLPWYRGPLRLLTRARRVEAAWWDTVTHSAAPATRGVLRDYYVAHGERTGWLWVFCEQTLPPRWFLHGVFA